MASVEAVLRQELVSNRLLFGPQAVQVLGVRADENDPTRIIADIVVPRCLDHIDLHLVVGNDNEVEADSISVQGGPAHAVH